MSNSKFKILIAPNSFKESASSVEISEYIKTSLFRFLPPQLNSQISFIIKPVSDGGDGFLDVCQRAFGAELLHFEISNPFNDEKFFCPVGYYSDTKTIYIESADVLGLKNMPIELRSPLTLSSKGMGELLLQLYESADTGIMEIAKVVIGIGGTGTNDLGMGMMEVFGLELYDSKDNPLSVIPRNFTHAEKIVVPEVKFPFQIELICDVENPLMGDEGATKVFAKQKGASEEEIEELEKGFNKILFELEVSKEEISRLHGAGGGLSAAMVLFFGAHEKFADEFIKEDLKINGSSGDYDLVITGEGKLDAQTVMNKGAFVIVNEFANKDIPLYFLCGISEGDLPKIENEKVIELSEYFDTVEESIQKVDKGIEIACRKMCKDIISLYAKKNTEKPN